MFRRPAFVLVSGLLLFLLSGAAPRALAAPAQPRVVITESRQVNVDPVGPHALRAAVESALKAQDADVVPESALTEAQARCADADCFAGLNRTTGATQVLLIDVTTANDEDYDLLLRLWEVSSGRFVDEDRVRCKLCLARDVLKIAHDQAAVLWSRYLHLAARSGNVAPLPPAQEPHASGPLISAPGAQPAPGGDDSGRFHRRLGWTLVGSGVAALAVGTVYWIENGRDHACRTFSDGQSCWTVADTAKIGLPLVAGGVVLAGVGGVLIYMSGRRPNQVAVGLTPGSIVVGGQF